MGGLSSHGDDLTDIVTGGSDDRIKINERYYRKIQLNYL